jgi:acyl-CoA hydrolase
MIVEKPVSASRTETTHLILPHHANQLGNLLGGQLMLWIDVTAAVCAAKHNQRVCVTASLDRLDFHRGVKVGDAVTLMASVNRAFGTSMEIGVKVVAESFKTGERVHANTAYLTFVAVDENVRPTPAVKVIPETETDRRRYREAEQRRAKRLADD